MEKNTENKKRSRSGPSGWDKKKKKEVADREKDSSKYTKLDAYFLFSTPTTSAAPEEEQELSMNLGTDNTPAPAATAQEMEFESAGDLITSPDSRMEDGDGTVSVRLRAIIDTNMEYPTDPHLFCETPVTPELVRALLELGPCQPGLKDKSENFPKDENGRHFSAKWYKKTSEK